MIAIIDYGIGNLRSVEKAFQAVSSDVKRTEAPDEIRAAEKVVLPGVGAFGACAAELRSRGLDRLVLEAVRSGKPLLGVCVGMQLLFDYSEEMGRHKGLGILPGRVRKFDPRSALPDGPEASPGRPLKVPHMGWNSVATLRPHPLLNDIDDGSYFYFVHSYFAEPADRNDVLAVSNYGQDFPAIVQRDKVYGIQFHPEKSQRNGLCILANFAAL